jgi:hypothetical protein
VSDGEKEKCGRPSPAVPTLGGKRGSACGAAGSVCPAVMVQWWWQWSRPRDARCTIGLKLNHCSNGSGPIFVYLFF